MDDATAIEQCIQGDRDAFRILVERYQSQAIAHATAILGSREDALDAVQEAYVDAFRALPRFDRARRFYPWLYVLLRNRCYKRHSGRRNPRADESWDPDLLEAASVDPDLAECVSLALSRLSPEHREIVILKYLDGLSYDELAERLSIPKGTVMSRLYNARLHLRAELMSENCHE